MFSTSISFSTPSVSVFELVPVFSISRIYILYMIESLGEGVFFRLRDPTTKLLLVGNLSEPIAQTPNSPTGSSKPRE